MNYKILSYLTIIAITLTLQSCVSSHSYVVSQPISNEINTKLKIPTKRTTLSNRKVSPARQINMALTVLEKRDINSEIEKTILHESKIDALLTEAESYLGTPYRFGGMSRHGIDCSAFVLSVFESAAGIELPRVASSQAMEGNKVDRDNLQKGDLVFFSHRGGGRISHVGIIHEITEDGDIKFIHAASSRGVMVSSLSDRYWASRYRFAKRILDRDYDTSQSVFADNNG